MLEPQKPSSGSSVGERRGLWRACPEPLCFSGPRRTNRSALWAPAGLPSGQVVPRSTWSYTGPVRALVPSGPLFLPVGAALFVELLWASLCPGPGPTRAYPSASCAALYVELCWANVCPGPWRVHLTTLLRRALRGATLGQPVPWSLAGPSFGQLCLALRGAMLGQRCPGPWRTHSSAFVPRSTWSCTGPVCARAPRRLLVRPLRLALRGALLGPGVPWPLEGPSFGPFGPRSTWSRLGQCAPWSLLGPSFGQLCRAPGQAL